jgi:serine/threonine-protein kinase
MTSDLREQLQRTLGDAYILERELGGGGMSRVFVAEETALGRKVVVKVLLPELAATVNIERFRREIQLAARLQHPHIVPVLAAGISEGLPYYTMPFIEGESLRARIARSGELPVPEAARILRDVLSALAYAHAHGVVHRDIKPDNVLLTGHHAVVTDFGVAKALSAATNPGSSLTSLGMALGTPAYMSPEQAVADPTTDHRADLYGVGAMAYEMLTGQQVFSARSPQAMLAAHAIETPEPLQRRRPSVPPEIAAVVMRSLEKRAADRPQSAEEMLANVEAAVTPSGATTPHTATDLRPRKTSDRRQMLMTMGAAVLVLGMASSTAYWYTRRGPSSSAAAADSTKSLAVLPFENLGKQDDAYFAEGMTEEISSRLGGISGLRVIGRQSVRGYANSNKPLSQIGKELGVTYVLTGSVRWDQSEAGGNRVRVSPALLRVSDGAQIWSEPYEDQLTGVFQMQSKVAEKVAQALKLQLTGGEQSAIAARPTDNVEAYDLYLRARAVRVGGLGGPQRRRAVDLLEQATRLDPKFSLAFAEMGYQHTEMAWFQEDPTEARTRLAKRAIDSALALNPRLAEAHLALGTYYYHANLDYTRALETYDIARRLDPNNPDVMVWKGLVLRRQGKWDEAIAEMGQAAVLDPRNVFNLTQLANCLKWTRQYGASDRILVRILDVDPGNANAYQARSVLALLRSGDVKASIAILREAAGRVSRETIDSEFLFFFWPATQDPMLRSMMEATPVPASASQKIWFFNAKMLNALYRKDSASALSLADSVLSLRRVLPTGGASNFRPIFAQAYAVRGEKAKAMEDAQKMVAGVPFSRDPFYATGRLENLVNVAVLAGDYDTAIATLQKLLSMPSDISKPYLRVHPFYEPLRRDSRFQALIAEN